MQIRYENNKDVMFEIDYMPEITEGGELVIVEDGQTVVIARGRWVGFVIKPHNR